MVSSGELSLTKRSDYLEADRVAVDIEVLDGNLGIVSHLLAAVRTGRRQRASGVAD